jgi:outer membrane protein, multidrug efflux system
MIVHPLRSPTLFHLIGIVLMAGCAVGPDYHPPEFPLPAEFSAAALGRGQASPSPAKWWESFGDKQLNDLLARAVVHNKSVQSSAANIASARSNRWQSTLDLLPVVTLQGQDIESQASEARFGLQAFGPGVVGQPDRTFRFAAANFDAVWELDFFGRVRRGVESASALEDAAAADLADAIRLALAETARNYLQLRGLQEQLRVARKNSENQAETVRLTEALFEGGRVTALDTARARSQLESTLATVPPLEHSIRATIYRISVLTGAIPSTLIPELSPVASMPSFSGPSVIANPSEVVRRRPDVRAAERRVLSANAQIGVAMGDYFPRISFIGSLGTEARKLDEVGDGGTDTYSFGPRITWGAFDLPRVYQRVRDADARTKAAIANYEQTVLFALEEVETSLSFFGSLRDRSSALGKAAGESAEAARLARIQYNDGIIDFLPVLDAERAQLSLELQLAAAETDYATSLVNIYKALGGGWEEFSVDSDGRVGLKPTEEAPPEESMTPPVLNTVPETPESTPTTE